MIPALIVSSSQKNTLNITSVNRDFKMVQTKPTNRCTVSYILFYITLSHNKRLTVSRILRPQSTSVSDKETAVLLNNQVQQFIGFHSMILNYIHFVSEPVGCALSSLYLYIQLPFVFSIYIFLGMATAFYAMFRFYALVAKFASYIVQILQFYDKID